MVVKLAMEELSDKMSKEVLELVVVLIIKMVVDIIPETTASDLAKGLSIPKKSKK